MGNATPSAMRIEGQICEGQQLDREGQRRDVRVTIIRGGASVNGYYYSEAALRAIAGLIENAQAYVDHARAEVDHATRSVRDMAGFYKDALYVPPGREDASGQYGRVDATLHILESAGWLWSVIREACALGRPELIGLSIDIYGTWQPMNESEARARSPDQARGLAKAQPLKEVTSVLSLNSCDIVTRPSAGGAFQHILHSAGMHPGTHLPHPDTMPLANPLPAISVGRGGRSPSGSQAHRRPIRLPCDQVGERPPCAADDAVGQQYPYTFPRLDPQTEGVLSMTEPYEQQETMGREVANTNDGTTQIREQTESEHETDTAQASMIREAQEAHTLLEELRRERAQLALERRLLESAFPEAVKAQIRSRYAGRIFEMTELEHDLSLNRQMLADLAAAGMIRGHGYEKPVIGAQITEAEKIQAAFDRMFDLDIDSRFGNIRGFTSIREAYARVTGDASVVGFSERSQLGQIRVSESAPITRISEADTTTATFSFLLGSSMNKRLLKDYQAWPAEWQKIVVVAPIKDFKQQTRVRLGAFGSLSTVAEDTAYTTISLSDTAATYVPSKRGNLVTVSRETIVNDDLFAIKQIPTKLAVAAAYTLAEFVYAFLSGNPTIYDGSALFTSGSPHNNLGSSALSTASMQAGVTAMREQANFAGKRIGLRPRYLIVPPELEWTAMVVTKSAGVPGSNNNDINPMMGYVTPIVAPQLTNTSQWFFAADPAEVDTIEVGFVGGQVNPALFIQDQPLFGLNFTQDVLSYL